jgi:hypothetical protein
MIIHLLLLPCISLNRQKLVNNPLHSSPPFTPFLLFSCRLFARLLSLVILSASEVLKGRVALVLPTVSACVCVGGEGKGGGSTSHCVVVSCFILFLLRRDSRVHVSLDNAQISVCWRESFVCSVAGSIRLELRLELRRCGGLG